LGKRANRESRGKLSEGDTMASKTAEKRKEEKRFWGACTEKKIGAERGKKNTQKPQTGGR